MTVVDGAWAGGEAVAESMSHALWLGGRTFQIETRPVPAPGPGEVRVRIHGCGVCLTEVHGIDDLVIISPPPCVLGHEYGGVVDALGEGVTGLAVGTPVACASRRGYAQYDVLPAERAFPLPAGVPVEHAAFVEPLGCCLAAEKQGATPLGGTVLLTGAGPMGLMVMQIVRRRAGARVIVSDPNPQRRALAAELGADEVVDPLAQSVEEAARAFTGGVGVHTAFEAAGNSAALRDCLRAVRYEGTVVLVGVAPATTQIPLDVYPFHRNNLRLIGSYGDRAGIGFASATAWLAHVRLAPLISHRFPLTEITQAFDVARDGRGMKVLITP